MTNSMNIAIQIFLMILNLIVVPFMDIGLLQYRKDIEIATTACKECIDKIIDTRQLTQDNEEYTAMYMSSTSSLFTYELERYAQSINLVPSAEATYEGETYVRYTKVSNMKSFTTGDIVRMHAYMVSRPLMVTLANTFLNLDIPIDDLYFAAVVR